MNRSRILALFTLIGLWTISCWEQQGHKSTTPELPNYTVFGMVRCSVTNEPLPDVSVYIDDNMTTTDSLGRFSIAHVNGGENHTISISRYNYESYNSSFLLGYADMDSFDVVLGRQIHFSARYQAPSPQPNGIVWMKDMVWSDCGDRKRVYLLDGANNFKTVKYVDSPGSYPPKGKYSTPYGLTVSEEGGIQYLWISIASADGGSQVYKMAVATDTTLTTVAQFDPPQSLYGQSVKVILNDLAYDGTSVWSCSASERCVYKHGADMSVVESYSFADENPMAIAWDGEKFWMTSSSSDRLYMLNPGDLKLAGYYVLPEAPVVGLVYRQDRLWGCRHGSQSMASYFYAYRVD